MKLRLDPTACDGHGLCAAAAPELIELDEWGYPVLTSDGANTLETPVRPAEGRHAKRAARVCPVLALRLQR